MQNLELIPDKELQAIAQYIARLKELDAQLIPTAENAAKLQKNLSFNGAAAMKSNPDAQLNQITQQGNAILTERASVSRQVTTAVKELSLAEAIQREQTRQSNAETRLSAKESLAAANSMDALRVKISQLTKTWGALDIDSAEFAQVGKELGDLRAKVTAAEMSVGQFGRNVGNYASGFNPLSFQVQQLARELPSLTVSSQQFFLAISNNLPMLADELTKAKAAQAALRAEGKAGVPVYKQLLSSIFSWQTALIVGITVITAYGKEIAGFFKTLFDGKEVIDTASEALSSMQKAMDFNDLGKQISDFEILASRYRKLGDDAEAKTQFIEKYKEEIERAGVAVNNITEADNLFINNSENFIDALRKRSIAMAGQSVVAEKYAQILQNNERLSEIPGEISAEMANDGLNIITTAELRRIEKLSGERDKLLSQNEDLRKEIQTISNESEKLLTESEQAIENVTEAAGNFDIARINRANESLSFAMRLRSLFEKNEKGNAGVDSSSASRARLGALNANRKALEDLATFEIEQRMRVIRRTLEANESTTSERMTLTNELYDLEEQRIRALAEIQRKNLIQKNIDENTTYNKDGSVKSTITEVKAAENVANQLIALQYATDAAIYESVSKRIQATRDLENQAVKDAIDGIQRHVRGFTRSLDAMESAELMSAETETGYFGDKERKKLEITRYYADLRNQAELDAMNERLEALKADPNIDIDEAKAILDLEQDIADKEVEINAEKNRRIVEDDRERAEKIKAIFQQSTDAIIDITSELVNAQTDRKLAALDKQLENAQKETDDEIAETERLYEAGAISEEQANARKAKAEQEQAAMEESIAAQQAAIQKRQARFNIIIDTARLIISAALTKPFIPAGLIAAASATAMGGVQLAAVNAAQYAEGTPEGGHPGGLAFVGDGGRAEMVIFGGKAYKSPAVPTLVDLPKGAEVLPDYNQAVRDMVMANALAPLRQLPVGTVAGKPYDDEKVIEKLNEANVIAKKHFTSFEREKANRRYSEFKNKRPKNRVS